MAQPFLHYKQTAPDYFQKCPAVFFKIVPSIYLTFRD